MSSQRKEIPVEQQLIYTVEEVAQLLKVNRNTVYNLLDKGLLKSIVLGRRKVTRKSLLAFLDQYDGQNLNVVTG